ncbi:hypothetical protein B0H15DRAFT_958307 [Mycena belliarum]|uniref:Uncharacterized protein n=1 Tax=Mycena belliarum TaxID=1033014 RepID=A0AAD6TQF1_9AGAR|nr:hypothetical protein B0H15DRAFT_958307 [Mycena belliae]
MLAKYAPSVNASGTLRAAPGSVNHFYDSDSLLKSVLSMIYILYGLRDRSGWRMIQGAVTSGLGTVTFFSRNREIEYFIGISLSRTNDFEGSAAATSTIGELVVMDALPPDTQCWSVLVDSIKFDGVEILLTSGIPNAPNGSLVAARDIGTPTTAPLPTVLYALHSRIPGTSVAPLDFIGTFPGSLEFDALLGSTFTRNSCINCADPHPIPVPPLIHFPSLNFGAPGLDTS